MKLKENIQKDYVDSNFKINVRNAKNAKYVKNMQDHILCKMKKDF